jgi:ankyrin repeat protein
VNNDNYYHKFENLVSWMFDINETQNQPKTSTTKQRQYDSTHVFMYVYIFSILHQISREYIFWVKFVLVSVKAVQSHLTAFSHYTTMNTLETAANDICRALYSSDWDRVDIIIDSVPEKDWPLPNVTFHAGQSTLHVAAEFNAPLYLLATLVQVFGIEALSITDKFGNTPLHYMALSATSLHALELIARAHPPAMVARNRSFQTPLDYLFRRGGEDDEVSASFASIALISLLEIYPEAIHDSDRDGQTLLHRCLQDVEDTDTLTNIIHTLLAAKTDLTEMADASGMIGLHEASKLDNGGEVVKLLLLHTPQLLWSAQNNIGRTALHIAIFWNATVDVVLALVTACPELVQIRDYSNKTPMEYFVTYHIFKDRTDNALCVSYFRHLQEWGLDDSIPSDEIARAFFVASPYGHVTNNGELVVHAALYTNGCPLSIVGLFIFKQPHLTSIVDGNGNLPIHIACWLRTISDGDADHYVAVVKELCMRFPQGPRMLDSQGKLPLTLMIEAEQPWNAMKIVLAAHPAAVLDQGLNSFETCTLLSKIDNDVRYRLLRDVPFLLDQYRNDLG